MKICIMRHGEAGFFASSDDKRQLTSFGIEQANLAGKWLKQRGFHFDLGLVSPYVRAQQTIKTLSSQVEIDAIKTDAMLIPSGDANEVASLLQSLTTEYKDGNLVVVSHLPLVGYLVNELCPDISPPMFGTADIACIDLLVQNSGTYNIGTLEWFRQKS